MFFSFENFVQGYIDAMLWANTYTEVDGELTNISEVPWGSELDMSDLSEKNRAEAERECREFLDYVSESDFQVEALIKAQDYYVGRSAYAGHDFALTRNGHGAGFWDRGLGMAGDVLTDAAKSFGEKNFYVDDALTVHAQ